MLAKNSIFVVATCHLYTSLLSCLLLSLLLTSWFLSVALMLAITKPLATRHPLLSLVLLLVCMLLFGFVVVVYASCTHNLIVLPTTQRLHSMSICVNVVTVHHVMLQVVCLQPKGTPSANYTDTHTTAELSRASFNKILLATSSFNNSPSAVVS